MTQQNILTGRRDHVQPKTARWVIRLLAVFLGAASVWSYHTELPEVAFAAGSIQPTGALRRIEHIDGGVVDSIFVREGEEVERDDLLVRLAAEDVDAELQSLRVREGVVLRALERNREVLDAIGLDPARPPTSVEAGIRADAQLEAYEAARRRYRDRVTALEGRIVAAEASIANVIARQAIEARERTRMDRLIDAGLTSKRDYEALEIRLNDLEGIRMRASLSRQEARDDSIDARNALAELFATTREGLLGDIEDSSEELALLRRAILENGMRRDRLRIVAPIEGIVQALYLNSHDEVVEPGGVIVEILPTSERLIAELRLKPRDIGHVQVGDHVEIRLTTFSAKRFGVLDGTVERISATSTENERFETFFKVRVELDRAHVGAYDDVHAIQAGMEVQASVVTGSRSVLEFMLAPILRPFRGAFGER